MFKKVFAKKKTTGRYKIIKLKAIEIKNWNEAKLLYKFFEAKKNFASCFKLNSIKKRYFKKKYFQGGFKYYCVLI